MYEQIARFEQEPNWQATYRFTRCGPGVDPHACLMRTLKPGLYYWNDPKQRMCGPMTDAATVAKDVAGDWVQLVTGTPPVAGAQIGFDEHFFNTGEIHHV